jgi:hypothetical protein
MHTSVKLVRSTTRIVRIPGQTPTKLARVKGGPRGADGVAGVVDLAANCDAADVAGDLVYVTGPDIGGLLQVAKVDIDDGAKMPAVGIIITKASSTDCTVRVSGEFDLSAGGLTPGDPIFVSATGTLTTAPPSRPGAGSRFIQRVGIALTAKKLMVRAEPLVHEVLP